ncbi:Abi family protein [Malacoplasma muris]|uniref:Abi family protein n=1 Tax=Malacoplasma muris TaxID=2119 RepID=UPI00398E321E
MDYSKKIENISNKLKLKIIDSQRFLVYLKIFSFDRILSEYSEPFFDDESSQFYDFCDSNQIINLIEFDRNVGTHIMKGVLFFENKFKNILINNWVEFYQLSNTKIYNFTDQELMHLMPNIKNCNDLNFQKFRYSLFEYASTSEFLISYSSLSDIPIRELSYSWALATAINFYRTLDTEIQKNILREMNIPDQFTSIFHKMMNVILKVRNMIAHNNVIYNFNSRHYRVEFNKIYSSVRRSDSQFDKYISIDKVCSLIDYVNQLSICIDGLNYELRNLSLNNYSKEYVIKLIYGLF